MIRDRTHLVGINGVQYETFSPHWWRVDRWFWMAWQKFTKRRTLGVIKILASDGEYSVRVIQILPQDKRWRRDDVQTRSEK